MGSSELLTFCTKADWSKLLENSEVQKLVKSIKEIAEGGGGAGAVILGGVEGKDYSSSKRIKLVVVGDGAVGKTSLLISFATGKFPTEYVPTVFENYTTPMDFQGETILLHLWDTAGQEDYDRLRPLSYPGTDIILLCFSTISKASYNSIQEKWWPEVHHYIPTAPHILVGTKVDCREAQEPDPNLGKFDPITTEMGEDMAKQIGATKYIEVSSRTRFNLDEVFKQAVKITLDSHGDVGAATGGAAAEGPSPTKKKQKSGCLLL
eukprot:TRINITY_DN1811_c0_g1_i1.p1 TRINITY_DN1811_c0_g1~~TRINITY_DN1811_c0_g1_i1.p1  ORF type:complete len:264 (-),score=54.11 TRINITY_DN1811_c0_g1_i1:61-852(-)